ncbi:Hsp70 family protein [Paracoccus aminophilus]|uniref:Molecular chaperone, DnaK n=1 Tax=Paracoccus aminophilus JCM 7686 TaxID=1367847 RepID=S5Y161_PARAH|nr:Hsp70 family protein [Paracoccus aminophilus]AGT11232.1 molecular chaperone, DnaK [Paracoccus aminophilus JCM 7686]
MTNTLAIDFGTSNSAAAILVDGAIRRIEIARGEETLPTAVFFAARGGQMQIGQDAVEALIAGDEGRFMRALKSILGTSLFHESRLIGGKRRTLAEIVTAFLATLKTRAEAATGHSFTRALSGRPVHFHSSDPERDARAEEDLRACYLAAGFETVDFMFEPEAAALAAHSLGKAGETGLIVDIGGGTSDFSIFRTDAGRVTILASHGLRLGGTDFDHAVSMAHAMPLLGHGGELRRTFGEGLLPVPNAVYAELSTWAKIPFLYNRDTTRLVEDMVKHAVEPVKMARLATVLDLELGHELAFSVEKGKIAANSNGAAQNIDMSFIERGLAAPISTDSLDAALAAYRQDLHRAIIETLALAEVAPGDIGRIILVGGSSLMALVAEAARAACPEAEVSLSEAFTAVVDGLALAAAA